MTAASDMRERAALPLKVSQVEVDERWDRFVATARDSTFCHLGGWAEVMSDVLRHECTYLVAESADGVWEGVLPLVQVRGILGRFLVSVPFLNDGGPVGTESARRHLVEYAVREADRLRVDLLELRARIAVPGPVATSNRKITVHLDLPDSVDALWAKTFKAKLRSQIRRPTKEGMTARSGLEEMPAFYEVFARNMRDLGTPVLPRRFFERMARVFGNQVTFTTVYTATGDPAAAGCCLTWREEIEIVWASSLRRYNRLSPNMLLYASVMEAAIAAGIRRFNFGRCTPGGPTHRFKQQWGGVDVPLPWAFWSKRGGAVGTPSPDKPFLRLAAAAWSRLPVAVTKRIGPTLARQLP